MEKLYKHSMDTIKHYIYTLAISWGHYMNATTTIHIDNKETIHIDSRGTLYIGIKNSQKSK